MSTTTPYTSGEIAKHNTDKDCWVIIDGKVYDSTEWLKDHPGGKAIIMGIAGQDATKQFDALHSKRTKKKLLKGKFATQVGVLASARL
jgi:cytochrome b involved in lipid metabolism